MKRYEDWAPENLADEGVESVHLVRDEIEGRVRTDHQRIPVRQRHQHPNAEQVTRICITRRSAFLGFWKAPS